MMVNIGIITNRVIVEFGDGFVEFTVAEATHHAARLLEAVALIQAGVSLKGTAAEFLEAMK
jgi:hypothetical protein